MMSSWLSYPDHPGSVEPKYIFFFVKYLFLCSLMYGNNNITKTCTAEIFSNENNLTIVEKETINRENVMLLVMSFIYFLSLN